MSLALNARRRDTVCLAGIVPRALPFTRSNNSIRFRHAIALDEHRRRERYQARRDAAVKLSLPSLSQKEAPTPLQE
jgi:hypothetical protein